MSVTFQRETLAQSLADILGMTEEHWRALARNKDIIPLDVDVAVYEAMEKANSLMILTVRDDGRLIGYSVYIVRPHPHYRTTKWALSDLFWITPKKRGAGVGKRMFEAAEMELRKMGVVVMNTYHKLAHPEAGPLLESLGHEPIEMTYQKVIA